MTENTHTFFGLFHIISEIVLVVNSRFFMKNKNKDYRFA